jgi:CubicO group peptidase (beta-lactamase class C family)
MTTPMLVGRVSLRSPWVALALAILWIGLPAVARADDLPRAHPEELGFSSQRLDYIDQFYSEKVKRGELAGIVTLIARHGKIVHFNAVGFADIDHKKKLQTDSLFRLYSMTKPIASTALMMLYEEGRFQLNDPLSKYIPAFAHLRVLSTPNAALDDTVPLERPPTIQDVLRHTAGFSHGGQQNAVDVAYNKADLFGLDVSLAQMIDKLSRIPLRCQPGTKFIYSIGPDVQARLVEILSGMSFDEFLQKRLFGPLGMKNTDFWLAADKAPRLAKVYWVKDGMLRPLDAAHGHPDGGFLVQPGSVNSYTVNHIRKGGSYGLVSSAQDYWRFAQMLLNGGVLDGTRILSPQVVRYMTRDHLGAIEMPLLDGRPSDGRPAGVGFGLGFAIMKDPAAAGFMSSEGTYYWAGAAATHFWVDPKEDLVVVAMSQHMGEPGGELWPQIRTLVYSALVQ